MNVGLNCILNEWLKQANGLIVNFIEQKEIKRILDYIYDNNPLDFDKSPIQEDIKKIEVQHPLEKVSLGIQKDKEVDFCKLAA